MRNTLIIIISLICFNAFSQETITAAQAKDFVGKEVILQGKVAGTKQLTTKAGDPLLRININKDYPEQDISIVIFNDVLSKVKFTEADLSGKSIQVQGQVLMYKEKPQIVLKNEVDLTIL